ncbi:TPA: Lrp/AsnC family transcriptional regulator [Candidatus Woesearchaeota archaeon]|nr:Lrp/AsnC family transcriptional regulator [Candidatus Woesearchaeota archaeon]
MGVIKLDIKDRKILYQLDVDARQPVAQIAEKAGLSREVVNYRIKNMEKNGVIEGYYATIDVTKLGYFYCRIFMRCNAISQLQENEIVNYGLKYPTIGWVTAGHGKWNISFVAYVKSLAEFEKTYDDLRFNLGKYFQEHYVSMAFKIHHFRHNYLFGTDDNSQSVLGEPFPPQKVDEEDLRIIKQLAKDARTPVVKLAESAGLKPGAVAMRIKRLVKNRVIIGFRPKINIALLGYEHCKVFLMFKNITPLKRTEIVAYLRYHPNVIYITKAFGIADLEFEVIVKGKNELYEFMQKFLSHFSGFIADYESIFYYRELINYLPS